MTPEKNKVSKETVSADLRVFLESEAVAKKVLDVLWNIYCLKACEKSFEDNEEVSPSLSIRLKVSEHFPQEMVNFFKVRILECTATDLAFIHEDIRQYGTNRGFWADVFEEKEVKKGGKPAYMVFCEKMAESLDHKAMTDGQLCLTPSQIKDIVKVGLAPASLSRSPGFRYFIKPEPSVLPGYYAVNVTLIARFVALLNELPKEEDRIGLYKKFFQNGPDALYRRATYHLAHPKFHRFPEMF